MQLRAATLAPSRCTRSRAAWTPRREVRRAPFLVRNASTTSSPTLEEPPRSPSPSSSLKGARKAPLFVVPEEEECVPSDDNDCSVFMDRDGNLVEVMCCDYGYRSGVGRMYSSKDGQIPSASGMQLAWDNFRDELQGIRRMFRYDEFSQISRVNPARGPIGLAAYNVGGAIVKAFARLDEAMESVGMLPKLTPDDPYASIVDPMTNQSMDQTSMDEVLGDCEQIRSLLQQLKLSNQKVWDREHAREAAGQGVVTPWYVKGAYLSLCVFLDVVFDNRPIQRFWFLETVARMPYFSYITCLHFYESLGWWRAAAELRKIHFAEEWNELHHLQIMESLGGDRLWVDRFLAYHSAIVYFWILVGLFIMSPRLAYNFSELIEAHAVDTYGEFADANKAILESLPPPLVAAQYYRSPDLYYFDEFQTSNPEGGPRTPKTDNLHDVFINIRDDEGEHVKTMHAVQDASVAGEIAMRKSKPRRV